ncbi:MAG: GFA family protein [Phenylobacterium sp.]|uniref:GFA family protein n=1 Tax=Phenylobacterium sp. TaxID=1871053 RepID=UPI001A4AE027|nr:GFA family protein [Phenylobacterium sp.]MBL8770817.1 GFA family protein [Phenylobacterium sp.]
MTRRSGEPGVARGACLCGAVEVEIGVPARWAWHDHGERSRRAQGAAYVTYVGSWRSRFRIAAGDEHVGRYEDDAHGEVRSFCRRCGAPVAYERARSPQMVNVPRALFRERTGREPRYHVHLAEAPDWAWRDEPLKPLKGYPGVSWAPPRRRKKPPDPMF